MILTFESDSGVSVFISELVHEMEKRAKTAPESTFDNCILFIFTTEFTENKVFGINQF